MVLLTRWFGLVVPMLALGCVDVDFDDGAEQLSSIDQELFSQTPVNYWNYDRTDGRGTRWRANTIPICFETGLDEAGTGYAYNTSQVANFATYKAWFREAVEDSWGRVAHLRFVHWGECPERNSARMSGWVAVHWSSGWAAGYGYQTWRWSRMSIVNPQSDPAYTKHKFQAYVRHEMGHVLGFSHEKDRPDLWEYVGTGPNCTASPQPGTVWTHYYDVGSIMNYSYCNEALGWLTPRDIYGVQRVYGRKPSRSVVGLGGRCVNTPGFNYTNGTVLQVYDCYGQSNDTWSRSFVSGKQIFGQLSSPYTVSVWSSQYPHNYWGAWTELQSYQGPTNNNVWLLDRVKWKAIGDMCVAPRDPYRGDNRLVLKYCDSQYTDWQWDYGVKGRFRNIGTGMCANVANASNATHTPINLYPCGNGGPEPVWNEVFTTTARGEIKWQGKCLNVANGDPVYDAPLQLYDCAPANATTSQLAYNDLFHISGRIMHGYHYDAALTISASDNVAANGAPIMTFPFYGTVYQNWDIYF